MRNSFFKSGKYHEKSCLVHCNLVVQNQKKNSWTQKKKELDQRLVIVIVLTETYEIIGYILNGDSINHFRNLNLIIISTISSISEKHQQAIYFVSQSLLDSD